MPSSLPKQRRTTNALALVILGVVAAFIGLCGGWLAPADPQKELLARYGSTRLVDLHGRPLRDWTGPLHARARVVDLGDVSPWLVHATLSLEDRRFFSHPGVDPVAILRAARSNLARGRIVSGASTLTQQVVKLMRPRGRDVEAKAREAVTALHLEARFGKRQILTWYLNFAPYGGLVHGAEQAAQVYFQKPARDLSLAEAAWLAVLPRAPSRLDPLRDPRRALPAQRALLAQMHAQGLCTQAQLQQALAQPVDVASAWRRLDAPHLADFAAAQLAPLLSFRPNSVRTTLDGALQDDVARSVDGHLRDLGARHVGNAAVVVIDNASGEVRALVGSRSYHDARHAGANNGATALRQPGSALKPITYAAAFDAGATAATLLADLPAHFDTAQGVWAPKNYGGQFRGPLRARVALANSVNIAAIKLLAWLGVPRLQRVLLDLGLDSLSRDAEHYGLALTLGDGEVTLLDLCAAYAALARGGNFLPARWLAGVRMSDGSEIAVPREAPHQAVSAPSAFLVTDILADAEARRLAFGRDGPLELPFPAAVKTGTSKGFRDNWAVGYTPRWTVGVWVGNFDGSAMRDVSGVTGAGPLWRDVMLRVAGADPPAPFVPVAGMQQAPICALSGQTATELCPQRVFEWFAQGTAPAPCQAHVQARIDVRNGLLAGPTCPNEWTQQRTLVDLPVEYASWLRQSHLSALPQADSPLCPSEQDRAPAETLHIESPHPGAIFYRDSQLSGEVQQIALIAHSRPEQPLQWSVDGRDLQGPLPSGQARLWSIVPGRHRLRVSSPGRSRSAEIEVQVDGGPDPARPWTAWPRSR